MTATSHAAMKWKWKNVGLRGPRRCLLNAALAAAAAAGTVGGQTN